MSDFLHRLKYLGLTARIKRMDDALTYSIKALYQSQNLDIEPGWHLILLLLKEEKQLSPLDLAQRLRVSQPAVTKVIRKMMVKGYVKQRVSDQDQRVKIVELTRKSQKAFAKWEPVWDAGAKAIEEMLVENEIFLEAFAQFENQQMRQSFGDRARSFLEK